MVIIAGGIRFVNHHCDPNTEFLAFDNDRMELVAKRAIEKGEEITVSYGKYYFDKLNPCLCSKHADGTIGKIISHEKLCISL